MILTVSLNPAVDKTLTVDCIAVGGINRISDVRRDPGGKGINVAKMVRRLGGDTLALGIVGGHDGAYIQTELTKMDIAHDFVVREEATRINYKITDSRLQNTTELNEPGSPVTAAQLDAVWQKLEAHTKPGDTVVLAGANPPGMPDDTLAIWIRKLREMQAVTVLDTIGEPMKLGLSERPSIIKPNLSELSEIFGEQLHYMRDTIAAARQVIQSGVERVVVSMGGDGALFVTKDGALRGYGLRVPIESTVGCGDVMLASLLYDLEQGRSWEDAARRSIATGTANAMCRGTEPPTLEQIGELVDQVKIERL